MAPPSSTAAGGRAAPRGIPDPAGGAQEGPGGGAAVEPHAATAFEDPEELTDILVPDGMPRVRPQTMLLLFCAAYMDDPQVAVFTGSLIAALGKVGVGEHAARSTVRRMVRRGGLEKVRRGKRIYLCLSPDTREMLAEGGRRTWRSPVNREWDGQWTLLGFSFPESRRADRHLLRSRLVWAGFGILQNGLWVNPRLVDVGSLVEDLGVQDSLKVFHATVADPTQAGDIIRDAWDLEELRAGYEGFLALWDVEDPMPDAPDDLARSMWLHAEWLLLARRDPGLPVQHLPADWPAVRAEHVALRLRQTYQPGASRVAAELMDCVRI